MVSSVENDPLRATSTLIVYAMAAVSGALGGCAAAAHVFLSRSGIRMAFVVAYMVIGAATSVGVAGFLLWQSGEAIEALSDATLHEVIWASVTSGAIGSLALSLIHAASRIVLKWRGVEIQVIAKKTGEKDG